MASGPLREWGAISIGLLAGFCFLNLPRRHRTLVLGFWTAAILGSALLEKLAPSAIDWLYFNVFDPQTRQLDELAAQSRLLGGVFGIQSLAKLMAWLPWLLWIHALGGLTPPAKWQVWILAVVSTVVTAAILATTQRGPFVASLTGWEFFALHRAFRLGDRRVLGWTVGGIAAVAALVWIIVPGDVIQSRVLSAFGQKDATRYGQMAEGNISFRRMIFEVSAEVISQSPLGNACVTPEVFAGHGIGFTTHSHHLFLHQFRERGWVWGLLHLLVWIWAGVLAWRSRSAAASAVLGGWTTIVVLGMFDHPWFVLNQAMVMSVILLSSFLLTLTPSQPVGYNSKS